MSALINEVKCIAVLARITISFLTNCSKNWR